MIVARNPGSAKKATSYAERLRLGIAVIHGEQKESECDEVDGRYSPPTLPKYVWKLMNFLPFFVPKLLTNIFF